MLHKRLVNALVKVGAKVTEHKRFGEDKPADHFYAELNGKCVDWYTEHNFNYETNKYETDVMYVGTVTMRHPDTDAQTDLFMDSYFRTIKSAVNALTRD